MAHYAPEMPFCFSKLFFIFGVVLFVSKKIPIGNLPEPSIASVSF
jgi:hypothetical protein